MSEDWDDWEQAAPVASAQPASGFGDTVSTTALRGMGRGMANNDGGFGLMNDSATTTGGVGRPLRAAGATMNGGSGFAAGDSGGFGGGFGSGFGSSSSGGFGSGSGGFGSGSGGFGSNSGGFGSDITFDGDSSRRGGRGGGRGGGSGGSRACFKCGEEGHMSRDCPKSGGGGGGSGSRACFKCGEEGHMSRDCPKAGSSGGGGGSRACFKCGEDGHISRDCPKSGGGSGGSRACFKCGEEGHMSRDCTNPGTGSGRNSRTSQGGFSSGSGFGGGFDDNEPRGGGFGARNGFGETSSNVRDGFGGADSTPTGFGGSSKGEGFGGSQRGGRGGGRGGRGGGGFGGGDGFSARDGFGDNTSSGFGNTSSGFGARDGFGSTTSGGFGGFDQQKSDGFADDKKSSGGGCHKCGEVGHFARECTKEPADGEKKRVPMYIPPPLPDDEDHMFETIQKGINFDKYDQINVECTGNDALKENDTIRSFAAADLDDVFKANVLKARYDKPTPIQKWAIPVIMRGRDLMACAQTGSGKTAAFLLPVLTQMRRAGVTGSAFSEIQEPQAIVVGPTRELVAQIHHEARKFAYNTMIRSVVVYGGVSTRHQIGELQKGAHIVIGTPGRLLDVIEKRIISLSKVRFLIFDEADRMLDMGFLPAMRKLVGNEEMPGKADRQALMFSATFPEEVQRLAQEILGDNYLFLVVGRVGGANLDIEQTVYNVDNQGKREKVLSILNESTGRTLVFVEQKRQADFLASYLSQMELPTTSIHGDREQKEREEALQDFKSGRARILVATSVAARGLDISGVEHVINYDMPSSIEDYVHRIGRTGRCGNIGRATSFFDVNTDSPLARPLVKVLVDAQQQIPDWLEEMSTATLGVGNFTGSAGRFEDSRRGNFGGGSSLSAGNVGSQSRAAYVEEDLW